ncbi:hypothetical protein BG006_000898 [Podila minutissima]|uniref:Uncharacterized protein n=1 Tax=Podila minutissima TaxID=64525 RepID=A0A9P5SAV0_9FUNG|nr:hypothetical protein BG006_000898 [Podila minutissima]
MDIQDESGPDPYADHAKEERYKFNRYSIVDRAPALSPPTNNSGRKYKYRERYAIKTRSRMIEHEPPDVMKQYTWKPWVAPPQSPKEDPSPPTPKEKLILSQICLPFTDKDRLNDEAVVGDGDVKQDSIEPEGAEEAAAENNAEVNDSNDHKNPALQYFVSILSAIYNSETPSMVPTPNSVLILAAHKFLTKAEEFLPPRTGAAAAPYAATTVLRSTALNLSVEFKKHFKNGSVELCKKIRSLKKKGLLPSNAVDNIDPELSPAEKFIILNKVSGCRRCLCPISSMDNKFVSLSELDLTKVFWKDEELKQLLQRWAHVDYPSSPVDKISLADVGYWLSSVEPGCLINRLVTDIGGYSEMERKKKRNLSKSTSRMSIAASRTIFMVSVKMILILHRIPPRDMLFGDRSGLMASLHELNCVKYRRLPPERLPDRVTTTLGGTDYYLSEVRNVVKSKEDVQLLQFPDKIFKEEQGHRVSVEEAYKVLQPVGQSKGGVPAYF